MLQLFNFAQGTVSIGYDASATSIALTSGHGARFPSAGPYRCVWWNQTDYPNPADDPNREIVEVTARSTDTLTITRGKETAFGGLAASTKNTASKTYGFALVTTAEQLDDMEKASDPSELFRIGMIDVVGNNQGTGSATTIDNFTGSHLENPVRKLDAGTAAPCGACVFAWNANGIGSARGKLDPSVLKWVEAGCRFWLPNLSDGTDTFRVYISLAALRTNAATDHTDGDHLLIAGSTASVVGEAGGVETSNGSTAVSANTLYKARLLWDIDAGTLKGWLNDVLVGTVSSGLPTFSTNGFGLDIGILKTAGTTNRTLYVARPYMRARFSS